MPKGERILEIRKAGEEHVGAILRLWEQLAREHAEKDPFYEPCENAAANFETYLLQIMESPVFAAFVCESEGWVIGYVTASIESHPPVVKRRRYGFIDNLVVDVARRRRGVGSALMEAAHGWLAKQGVTRMELNVSSSNEVGMAFWRALGFKEHQVVMCREKEI